MASYYRVFYLPQHYNDWKSNHFHSYHNSVPGEWSDLYYNKKVRNRSDYPLQCHIGKFTQEALDAFFQIVPKYPSGGIWDNCELKDVSQLDGVCAFSKPDDAYNWGKDSGQGWHAAEFEGSYVCDIPESDGGLSGVLAKVISKQGCYTPTEFQKRHGLQ